MLSTSNKDVIETLAKFKTAGFDATFLVPTDTGLKKSILDATHSLRSKLREWGVHDYEDQGQGPKHKQVVSIDMLGLAGIRSSLNCSMYRPETKNGDPRIWISSMHKDCLPTDLIALLPANSGQMLGVNCSVVDLDRLLDVGEVLINGVYVGSYDMPSHNFQQDNGSFKELLGKLIDVSSMGYVDSLRSGDTGVGYTLETILGIQANSNKAPDFKGVEIKSKRSKKSASQTALFSQVPDWSISRLKSSKEILLERGRFSEEKQRLQLFHEISARKPNSYDLMLELDTDQSLPRLKQVLVRPHGEESVHDVSWAMARLTKRLTDKHKETAWVSADTRKDSGGNEQFWYREVTHTQQPDINAFPILLESGAITVHYLIKQLPSGAAKDQGYLFKMESKYIPALFGSEQSYDLGC